MCPSTVVFASIANVRATGSFAGSLRTTVIESGLTSVTVPEKTEFLVAVLWAGGLVGGEDWAPTTPIAINSAHTNRLTISRIVEIRRWCVRIRLNCVHYFGPLRFRRRQLGRNPFQWQPDPKLRALSVLALHVNRAPMRPYNPRHEAQSQTQALLRRGLFIFAADTVKPVENMRQVLSGNSPPRVLHADFGLITRASHAHQHPSTFRSELDRVREQVRKHAIDLHAIEIAFAMRNGCAELEPHARAFGRNLELIGNLARHCHQIQTLFLQHHLAAFRLRQEQQRPHNLR